jgi:hypothetical protein
VLYQARTHWSPWSMGSLNEQSLARAELCTGNYVLEPSAQSQTAIRGSDNHERGSVMKSGTPTAVLGLVAILSSSNVFSSETRGETWGWVPYGNPSDRCWDEGAHGHGPCGNRPEFVYVCKVTPHGGVTLRLPKHTAWRRVSSGHEDIYPGKCEPGVPSPHKCPRDKGPHDWNAAL